MVRKLLTLLAVMALGVLSDERLEIFNRMPQKHVRPLDVMYWEHPAYDSDYVVRAHRFHLEKAAEQLTEIMDMHGVPLIIQETVTPVRHLATAVNFGGNMIQTITLMTTCTTAFDSAPFLERGLD